MVLTIQEEIDKYVNSSGFSTEDVKQSAIKLFRNFADVGNAIVSIVDNTGIAGFKFHIPESEQIKFQSEITDHYIDTNVAVQDHIAQKPVIVTLRGLQGDYFYSVHKLSDLISTAATAYKLVKEFLPSLTAHAKQALANKWKNNPVSKFKTLSKTNTATKNAFEALNGVDLFTLFQSLYKLKSPQTRAYFFLKSLWKSKALFTVETTYERFENMAIQDLTPLRDKNLDITDFSVTFKQISRTQSLYRSYENAIGRTKDQLSEIQKKGVDKGQKTETI